MSNGRDMSSGGGPYPVCFPRLFLAASLPVLLILKEELSSCQYVYYLGLFSVLFGLGDGLDDGCWFLFFFQFGWIWI